MSCQMDTTKGFNLVLGITGSVASIKLNELIKTLRDRLPSINICILPTKNSLHFVPSFDQTYNQQFPELKTRLELLKDTTNRVGLVFAFTDEDEWLSWGKRNDPVLHIEVRKWAHMCLIAPLDANTLGKISNGLCDNLLTSVVRAWDIGDIKSKPVIVCPAMNTAMYNHPITKRQFDLLVRDFGFTLIDSIEKTLMCGDTGVGAMATVDQIVSKVVFHFNKTF